MYISMIFFFYFPKSLLLKTKQKVMFKSRGNSSNVGSETVTVISYNRE